MDHTLLGLQLFINYRALGVGLRSELTVEEFNFFAKRTYQRIYCTLDNWKDYTEVPGFVKWCYQEGFLFPCDKNAYIPAVQAVGMIPPMSYSRRLLEFISSCEDIHLSAPFRAFPDESFNMDYPSLADRPFPDTSVPVENQLIPKEVVRNFFFMLFHSLPLCFLGISSSTCISPIDQFIFAMFREL